MKIPAIGLAAAALLASGLHQPLSAQIAPQGPHELCRELVRSLEDGAVLGVKRCWTVRFVAQQGDLRMDGEQSRVAVDAPPALTALARLEEKRVETGMFPLVMSPDGLIQPSAGQNSGGTLLEMQEAATAIITALEPDPAAADAMRSFVAQVAAASAEHLGRIPRDLLYPVPPQGPETIAVTLPDGSSGSVTIEQSATAHPETGLLQTARRSVVTRAGLTASESVETWVLTPTG